MSYVAGALAIFSMYQGYMASKGAQGGTLAQADEYEQLELETHLTKQMNWKMRNEATFQTKLKTLQGGMREAGMAGLSGLKVVENMKADIGGSGAKVGVGTTNDIIINQHLQNANQQLAIMQGTKEKLSAIDQNAIAVNKMEDWKANMRIAQLKRAARTARSGADSTFFAGILNSFSNAGQTYISAGGKFG